MKTVHSGLANKPFTALLAGAVIWTLCLTNVGAAQGRYANVGTIDAGTTITVRTNEQIDARDSDGRIFTGVVEQDVTNRNGYIAIPRGSDVELVVKRTSNNEVALDLDSVMVNGRRFAVQSESNVVSAERKEGLGVNDRTGKYVGGGAVLGAIIGAIAGGGKGAAIGAGAGAAAGAGTQILTRGGSVRVPAESLLTYRLAAPLRAGVVDNGYMNNGVHYHNGYGDYRDTSNNNYRQKPSPYYDNGRTDNRTYDNGTSITIGNDNNVRWQGVENSTVYVSVDNDAPRLFAAAPSGTQLAPWIQQGHVYVFMLRDASGNEIARDRLDLRSTRNRFRR